MGQTSFEPTATFSDAEILIYNTNPLSEGGPTKEYGSGLVDLIPLRGSPSQNNALTNYSFTLPEEARLKLERNVPTQYWVLVTACGDFSSFGTTGPYLSQLMRLDVPALQAASQEFSLPTDDQTVQQIAVLQMPGNGLGVNAATSLVATVTWGMVRTVTMFTRQDPAST